jgi:predicted phosphate transport protein (TIGR00153 family)
MVGFALVSSLLRDRDRSVPHEGRMRLDSIIKMFLPREERFQELLLKDTQNLTRAAELFLAIARSTKLEDRRIKLVELKALEHEGDEITRQVFEALNRSFITPLDREDIRSIVVDLDDILDYLEGIARYLVIFQIDEAPEPLTRFAEILLEMIGEIDSVTRLIWDLGNEPAIRDKMVRISELENQGDDLFLTVIADLFRSDSGRNAMDTMKWKEIYQNLEDACDSCKDFTHIIGNVVIKNA